MATMEKGRFCVTGAGGYLGSWVVNLLLSKGYTVHGTVRNPDDEKYAHLKKLDRALENLKLFKADLLDYESLHSAIQECSGVFHVASPVPSITVPNPEVEVIEPAVKGTLNVLKSCVEAKVKRVVFVSSSSAIAMNPSWPKGQVKDETCWSDKEYCKTTKNWYCFSKTEAESEALEFAKRTGLDVVTVCPTLILGPLLQSKVNSSSLILIKLLKGAGIFLEVCNIQDYVSSMLFQIDYFETLLKSNTKLLEGYESRENKFRMIVDVRDVAEALLLAYEKPEAEGRYVCTAHIIKECDVVDKLRSLYPNYNYPKSYIEVEDGEELTSEKLQKLGWTYRPLEETLVDSVESYKKAGILD